MAEMHDFYQPGEYDVAGFVIGMVDEEKIINGSTIMPGDVCIGLPSNGLHTNGYTLARKAVFETAGLRPDSMIKALETTAEKALMKVHRCYAPLIHPVLEKHTVHGMAHITGGGIPGNLKRILPDGMMAEIDKKSWPVLPIFDFLREAGDIDPEDIYSAFNMGIGYILVVPESEAEPVEASLAGMGEKAYRIGKIIQGEKSVRLVE
jgi:phosphoribosylformylglycinamidine cyclo-ligase